jgi:glycosyltransferase involved in cell wall biosynthesis
MNDIRVSILIAVYNRERFVGEAVHSALAQDFNNFEVVVVDDGSDDRTPEVLAGFTDPRLRVIRKPHTRCWDAKNRAVAEARGEWIVFLDSDDYLAPDYLEKAMREIGRDPNVDWLYPLRLQIVDEAGALSDRSWKYLEIPPATSLQIVELFLRQLTGGAPHTGAFVRREVFTRHGMFDGDLYNFGDTDYVVRRAHLLRFRSVSDLNGYFKRHHGEQICTRMDTRSKVMADLLRFILDHYSPETFFPAHPTGGQAREASGLSVELVLNHGRNPVFTDETHREPFQRLGADLLRASRGMPPRVTVHIAVHNRRELFRRTLDAVLRFRGVNFDVVVVDDGSDEDIRSVVDAAGDARVRFIRSEINLGPWVSFNRAIRESRGEWIIPVGSDDLPTPGYLEAMVNASEKDCDYLYPARFPLIDADDNPKNEQWSFGDFTGEGSWEIPRIMLRLASGPVPHAGALIRRSLYHRLGFYDEKPNVQDTVWISRNFDRVRFRRVQAESYLYRVHEGNVSRSHPENRQESLSRAIGEMALRLPAEKLFPYLAKLPADARETARRGLVAEQFLHHARNAGDFAQFWRLS